MKNTFILGITLSEHKYDWKKGSPQRKFKYERQIFEKILLSIENEDPNIDMFNFEIIQENFNDTNDYMKKAQCEGEKFLTEPILKGIYN